MSPEEAFKEYKSLLGYLHEFPDLSCMEYKREKLKEKLLKHFDNDSNVIVILDNLPSSLSFDNFSYFVKHFLEFEEQYLLCSSNCL